MERKQNLHNLVTWLFLSVVYGILISLMGIKMQGFLFFYCIYMGSLIVCHYFQFRQILIWTEIKDLLISHIMYCIFSSLALFSFFTSFISLLFWNIITTGIMFCVTLVYKRTMHILFRKQLARKTLIIGTDEDALHLAFLSKTNRFALIDVLGLVEFRKTDKKRINDYKIYQFGQLQEIVRELKITQIIIALPDIDSNILSNMMRDLSKLVNHIKYVPRTNGMMNYDSEIQDFDGILLISTVRKRDRILSRLVKRIVDICAGLLGCLLLVPISIYVKIRFLKDGDKESIFFKQKRIGKNGKPIYIYKYRSMIPNAEAVLEDLMEKDPEIKKEYLENKKLKNDPRITPLGEKLRRSSLDEFPQFFNILKGDMSLVGPRPYLYREIEDMDYYDDIVQCTPGLTGMWQISGRNNISFTDRCALDEYYYLNWTIWLDLTIFIKTIKPVLTKEGSM